jgi:murein DD-endopeptidase MepM/ murein hydrolase activator NlpD
MRKLSIAILSLFLLASCSPTEQDTQSTPELLPSDTPILATFTLPPTETPIPATPTPETIDQICSPLQDVALSELSEILTQPYKTPAGPGKDDGHHGADFAFFRFKDYVGIEGLPVLAALEGEVVTILNDRPPYGHAIIIETPLNKIDPALAAAMQLPETGATVEPAPNVNCPPGRELPFTLSETERSVYILYAHLRELPTLQVGDLVECGQFIGEVGNTGKGFSTNPHLHFETRIGPSGARFESMAYYTVQSTEAERYNYCVWRVTNLFQLFDPMILLSTQN